MAFLSKSLKKLKEKFCTLFLLELVFFFALFFFLVFIKSKIQDYILVLQEYSLQVAALQETASKAQLAQFINNFEVVTQQVLVFIYLIVPIVFLIIWCVTQSLIWKNIKDKKIKSFRNFFFKFSFISIIIFAIIYFISSLFLRDFVYAMMTGSGIVESLLIFFIFFSFLSLFSAVLYNDSLLKTLKRTFKITFKKIHRVILVFFLHFIVILALIFLFLMLFSTYTLGENIFLPIVPLMIYTIICIIISMFLKLVLQQKVDEIK